MTKVLVVIDQLSLGGAGRVCSIFINGLIERGYHVAVCTAIKYHPIKYHISDKAIIKEWYDPEPKRHNLLGKLSNTIKRNIYYRRALREVQPDIIVAFTHSMYFYVKLWSYGYNVPIIVSDHTSMGRDLGAISNYIRHQYYAQADLVTVLTKKDARLIEGLIPNNVVLYNPVTFDSVQNQVHRKKNIICIGRKDYWHVKGFDRIIEIWAKLAHKYPEWILEIIGPGKIESEQHLKSIAEKMGVVHRVSFIGEQTDMQSIYQTSSIFALSSRVEGFPLVLLEAMSQGCACISFSMQGAVDEILNNNIDGYIVEDNDIDAFAEKLENIILDRSQRDKFSNHAIKNVKRFSKDVYIDNWDNIIKQILSKK